MKSYWSVYRETVGHFDSKELLANARMLRHVVHQSHRTFVPLHSVCVTKCNEHLLRMVRSVQTDGRTDGRCSAVERPDSIAAALRPT